MAKSIYMPENTWQTPIIEDDEVTSKYAYKINYGRANVKIHEKNNETPEHTIYFENSCSLTLLLDLPHNVVNKLDDYRLNYGPLEYETINNQFKESYVLPVRPPWNEIDYIVSSSFELSCSIIYVTQSNTNDVIVLGDDDYNGIIQEKYCNIQSPYLVDASGSRIDANVQITTKKVQGKDVDVLRYSVDETWLDNAVYPVTIDPSILLYTTTNTISMYSTYNPMVVRNSKGDIGFLQGERDTWRLRYWKGRGDSFNHTSSVVDVGTGTTYFDYQNLILADNGRLVAIYRDRNGGNNIKSKYSADNGATWTGEVILNSGYGSWNGNGVSACKSDNGYIWAQAESGNSSYEQGLFNSTDNGTSWTYLTPTDNTQRKWYGDICFDRKNNNIRILGCDQVTNRVGRTRIWNIDAGAYTAAGVYMPNAGIPNFDRSIAGGGIACDNDGNAIIWVRVRYTSDSLYRLWEFKWTSGSAVSNGSVISIGDGLGSQVYGVIRCDRDGNFHKYITAGATVSNTGLYYSSGKFNHSSSYNEIIYTPSGSDDINQVNVFVNNLYEEYVSEFHMVNVDIGASTNRHLKYSDDNIRSVGVQQIGTLIG